jgi:hypothetical protein
VLHSELVSCTQAITIAAAANQKLYHGIITYRSYDGTFGVLPLAFTLKHLRQHMSLCAMLTPSVSSMHRRLAASEVVNRFRDAIGKLVMI